MKKAILIFMISTLVLIAVFVWTLRAEISWDVEEILMVSGIFILVGFALFIGIQRIRSLARKEPPEDEFSKKVMVKASSLSYYISLYMWLFLMYISDKVPWEIHTLLGAGIMGMAIIFFLSWLGVKFTGLRNG